MNVYGDVYRVFMEGHLRPDWTGGNNGDSLLLGMGVFLKAADHGDL